MDFQGIVHGEFINEFSSGSGSFFLVSDSYAPGLRWFDPVMADGFEFDMINSGSYFTAADMPVGLGDPNCYILQYMDGDGLVNILLNEGGTRNFPSGVDYFKMLDIDPYFDPDHPSAVRVPKLRRHAHTPTASPRRRRWGSCCGELSNLRIVGLSISRASPTVRVA